MRHTEQCVYCGSRDDLTADHIPPRCLFNTPRPGNLITVPSCRGCNAGFSIEDEFFRTIIACDPSTASHPQAAQLWDAKIRRQLIRSDESTIKGLIRQSFGNIEGTDERVARAMDRLAKYVERIVRGLFYHEIKRPLPLAAVVRMNLEVSPVESQTCATLVADFWEQGNHFGDGVFSYWSTKASAVENATSWLLLFYKARAFCCETAK